MNSGLIKKIIIVLVVIVLGFAGYIFVTKKTKNGTTNPTTGTVVTENPEVKEEGSIPVRELADMVAQLQNIKLDTVIFGDKTFRSLIDFTLTVTPELRERPNPFAPIGTD
jgi:hypothetical protein